MISRPYIFTASPAPPVVAATQAALKQVLRGHDLRARLWRHAERLYAEATRIGYRLGTDQPGPVAALVFSERDAALALWQGLLDSGIYTNLMIPPATPSGVSLVRISLSAAHSDSDISQIIAALDSQSRRLRLPVAA